MFDPKIHHRHSIRLAGYDYSNMGAYFVTICAHNKNCIFGKIDNGLMNTNELGKIVATEWLKSETIRHDLQLDEHIVMPNHFHAIFIVGSQDIRVDDVVGAHCVRPNTYTDLYSGERNSPLRTNVGSLIAGFKAAVTKQARNAGLAQTIWQRSYFEHIIRNENDLNSVRQYIFYNPYNWATDENYRH